MAIGWRCTEHFRVCGAIKQIRLRYADRGTPHGMRCQRCLCGFILGDCLPPEMTMSNAQYSLLEAPLRPLMDKFYRAHFSPMRTSREGVQWVARRPDIIGGLCLTPVADGQWLTGLFVDPAHREQGVAAGLIDAATQTVTGPVWLFCHPNLREFYEKLGFTTGPVLPKPLHDKLARYSMSKLLIALGRQSSAAGSRSGNSTSV